MPGGANFGLGNLFQSAAKTGGGMDPATMMMLGSMGSSLLGGLFGGGSEGQERHRYSGASNPVDSLNYVLQAIQRMGAGLESRGAPRLSSGSMVQPGPGPVSVPGVPFQIGGGLGMDPALRDPSILQGLAPPTQWQPFQGGAQKQWGDAGFDVSGSAPKPKQAPAQSGSNPGVRRRMPRGK